MVAGPMIWTIPVTGWYEIAIYFQSYAGPLLAIDSSQ